MLREALEVRGEGLGKAIDRLFSCRRWWVYGCMFVG